MRTNINKARDERDQGFTLIELLVVIIIIGILAAIAIPVFLNQRKKGVDAGIKSDLKNAATAAETYATDNPSDTDFVSADPDGAGPLTGALAENFTSGGFKKSPQNVVEVKGGPAGGYCLRGSNPGQSAASGSFFHYDSVLGGLQPTAAATSANGVCNGVGTGFSPLA